MTPSPWDALAAPVVPLQATGLTRSFADRLSRGRVLDGIDLTVGPGQRLGVIGENGSGKSTLLRLLAGVDSADSGSVVAPQDLVLVPQEPAHVRGTVADFLDEVLSVMRRAVAKFERLAELLADQTSVPPQTGAEFDALLDWLTRHDAWDAERRTHVTATALGVGDLEPERPVSTLSGGQRTRLALAAALVRRPACLILDEPTNHLDDAGLDLLERTLVDLPGIVVAASHDRTFLDRVCTRLMDLDAGELGTDGHGGRLFTGGYVDYLREQSDSRRRWEETYATQQEEITRLRGLTRIGTEAIAHNRGPRDNDKYYYAFKAGNVERARARRVHDAQRRLEVAERAAVRKPRTPLRFWGRLSPATGRGPAPGGLLVSIRDLCVSSTPDPEGRPRPRLRVPRLDVAVGDKVLVTGPNGSGKSTLLLVLAGQLTPSAGVAAVRARRVRLLAQDVVFDDPRLSVEALYASAVGAAYAERLPLRALGLIAAADLTRPVGSLSLGQQRRLELAIAVAAAPDLLLLDEPTNHISLRLATELEEALQVSPGTVVLTSHDRWLRRRWGSPTLDLTFHQ